MGGNKIQFTAGSEYVTINGKSQKMAYGVYAEIKDSRMFVPFRTLGEAVGAKGGLGRKKQKLLYLINV